MSSVNPAEAFATLSELRAAAKEKLPRDIWGYVAGAAGAEATRRRNRRAVRRLALQQHVLTDVREVDTGVTLFGAQVAAPIIVAPMGGLATGWPDGELEMARGATAAAHLHTVSGSCLWPMEDSAALGGPLIFQLYFHGDRDWAAARLARVQAAGYRAVALTVDSAVYSRRERDLVNRYRPRARTGGSEPRGPDDTYPARLTWDDAAWVKNMLRVPFGLKGIMTADDALRSLDLGAEFVWISNHGGRQLDDGLATIDLLPAIAAVVGGRVPIIIDGGFRRGSDVVKALALGASAVAMGRTLFYGLAAAGSAGVQRTLDLLDLELRITLALMGRTSLRELSPDDAAAGRN
ncbi:MAG: alpha-hydroxy acid oxidase [Chloroflexota bacterium]